MSGTTTYNTVWEFKLPFLWLFSGVQTSLTALQLEGWTVQSSHQPSVDVQTLEVTIQNPAGWVSEATITIIEGGTKAETSQNEDRQEEAQEEGCGQGGSRHRKAFLSVQLRTRDNMYDYGFLRAHAYALYRALPWNDKKCPELCPTILLPPKVFIKGHQA
ncbi:hypothetical protein QOT17_009134 [Balamuthia mandrillaris]